MVNRVTWNEISEWVELLCTQFDDSNLNVRVIFQLDHIHISNTSIDHFYSWERKLKFASVTQRGQNDLPDSSFDLGCF